MSSFPLSSHQAITPAMLEKITEGTCPCCGEPFNADNAPDLTGKCHIGPVFVSYFDGWLYLECGNAQCRKPIGRIKIEQFTEINNNN